MSGNQERRRATMIYQDPFSERDLRYTGLTLQEDFALSERFQAACAGIHGQDYAIQAIKEYLQGMERERKEKGVLGSILMAGLPATGKTSLAGCIANALEIPMLRLDMSSFGDKEAMGDLAGNNAVFHSASAGRLTEWARKHPHSVVLVDELEKAHDKVKKLFLQILSEGELFDLFLKEMISFRDTVFVFTTNVGQELCERRAGCYNFATLPQSAIVHALTTERNPEQNTPWFPSALVSRLTNGKLIMLNKLRPEVLHRIAMDELKRLAAELRLRYKLELRWDLSQIATMILLHQGEFADPRTVLKACKELVGQSVSRLTQLAQEAGGSFGEILHEVDTANVSAEVTELLSGSEKRILLHGTRAPRPTRADGSVRYLLPEELADAEPAVLMDLNAAVICIDDADARALFDRVSVYEEVPIYVYSAEGKARSAFYDYTDRCATDCYSSAFSKQSPEEWLAEVERGVELTASVQGLFRTNKVLEFDLKRELENGLAHVRFEKLRVTTVMTAEDEDSFVRARDIPAVTYADVIGQEPAKRALEQAAGMLRRYRYYQQNGLKLPRGILLTGAPGGGKTMLAKATANSCGMPFMQYNATEFIRKYFGEGPRMVREMFARARRYAPCVLFVDEIDAVSRSRMEGGQNREYIANVTNTFLSEMDGFLSGGGAPVLVICATNFGTKRGETQLDEAFLRRFDHKIEITLPDRAHRLELLRRAVNGVRGASVEEQLLGQIADRSVDWSPADLSNVVNNAVRSYEAAHGAVGLDAEQLMEAFESYFDGEARAHSAKEIRQTAYHEAAHAMVSSLLGEAPAFVTVVSRGDYGGYVQRGENDKTRSTRRDLENFICTALASRAAEVLLFGEDGVNTGASMDLRQASEAAMRMVCEFGMSGSGLLVISERDRGEEEKRRAEEILREQYRRAEELIAGNRLLLDRIAACLTKQNSLSGEELAELMKKR